MGEVDDRLGFWRMRCQRLFLEFNECSTTICYRVVDGENIVRHDGSR